MAHPVCPNAASGRTSTFNLRDASSDDFGVKERHEYLYFAAAAIAAFFGVLLLVAFSGSHSDCGTPLPADVPNGLRDCDRIGMFYVAGWVLIVVAVIVTSVGVRAVLRRSNETGQSPP